MNGLACFLIAVMLFWSAAEQAAPGVTAEAVRVAAMIYTDPQLPAQLDAAITAKESTR